MNSSSQASNENKRTIAELFKTMDLDSSPVKRTHNTSALNWLKAHDYFLGFVNGDYLPKPKSFDDNSKKRYYDTDIWVAFENACLKEIEEAAVNSLEGFKKWHQFDGETKSKLLYKIALFLEQQSKLINGVENLTPVGRLKEKYNVPYLVESFNYYAGLVGDADIYSEWNSIGVVCIANERKEKPSVISMLWRISSLLAAGNAVLILNCSRSLSPFLFAELCHTAGLPPGLLNVVNYKGSYFRFLSKVNKVILSSLEHKQLIEFTSVEHVPCEILPYRRPCMIVYESADLDAATDNILETILAGTEGIWSNCKIYLQESIQEKFFQLLGRKVFHIIDVATSSQFPLFYIQANGVLSEQIFPKLTQHPTECFKGVCGVCDSVASEFDKQCTHAAYINLSPISKKDQICVGKSGPGICIEIFRTVKESVAMFNTSKLGLDASIWTEEMSLALEISHKLQTRTVWINSQNLFEPTVPYGSLYLSGNSVIGGKEGFFSQLSITERCEDSNASIWEDWEPYGAKIPVSNIKSPANKEKIAKNMKLYIGGSFSNSSDDAQRITFDAENKPYAYIACANESDVQKAVLCASSSQPKWEKLSKIKRSAMIQKVCELLTKRKDEFLSELSATTGSQKEICLEEINKAIRVLSFWANRIMHFDGIVPDTMHYAKVLLERHPIGVIGVQCPDESPLLSFIFLITPAIIFGNSVVAIASEKYPTCALKMCEIFHAAGLPAGVLNVISNSRAYLTRHLTFQLSIDALWFTMDGVSFIYESIASVQPRKISNFKNMTYKLNEAKILNFVNQSTYTKAIYIPMGSDFIE